MTEIETEPEPDEVEPPFSILKYLLGIFGSIGLIAGIGIFLALEYGIPYPVTYLGSIGLVILGGWAWVKVK